jgi:uncharacterized protein
MNFESIIEKAWKIVLEKTIVPKESPHGLEHWKRVEEYGLSLAEKTGADKIIVSLFALFHDCMRLTDGNDPGHGLRGAEFMKSIRSELDLTDEQFEKLYYACQWHTDQQHTDDITIGTCWDADRLDLKRVEIMPDIRFLNTEPAKEFIKKVYKGGQTMITVENQKFYHIQRGEVPKGGHQWNIGKRDYWGKEQNFVIDTFFKGNYEFFLPIPGQGHKLERFDSATWILDEMIRFFETGQKTPRFASFFDYDPVTAFKTCFQILHTHRYILREMVFEEVRKELNQELPSRYTGLWVIDDHPEELQYWYETLAGDDKSTIITLNLTGKIHLGNIEYIPDAIYSVDELRGKALKYWNNYPSVMGKRDEYLFEGYATVMDVSSPDKFGLKPGRFDSLDIFKAACEN